MDFDSSSNKKKSFLLTAVLVLPFEIGFTKENYNLLISTAFRAKQKLKLLSY